jgi:hypothetical protein
MAGNIDFRYNTGLANYQGGASAKLVVDSGTLITLAKADPSGSQLDLLFRTGRDVVITSTIRTEAANRSFADGATIDDWIARNHNRLIVDDNPANPAFVPQSNNGEKSIIGYVERTGGDIRVVTEDLRWMDGRAPDLAAARDLAGTSGVNLTTNEFVNDLLLSGSISPYEHAYASFSILKIDPVRTNLEQQNLLLKIGDEIQLVDQNGNVGHLIYLGPLGAAAFNEDWLPIGFPAGPNGRLNIPASSSMKFTEADHFDEAASLAYGSVETVNGKLTIVGEDTDHSTLLQQAKFEYDPNTGIMTRSLVKDDGSGIKWETDGANNQPWSSETSAFDAYQRLQSQRVVFDGGGQQVKEYDPNNTHPYSELDIDEDATGKVTAANPKLDGQPNADFSAVGQVLGSALGRALAPNNQFVQLVAGTVVGAVGQKLAQAFAASLATNAAANVNFASVFADFNVSIAGAGASSIASFLVAELGTALHFPGFSGQLFNAAAGGFAGSVASQIASKMAQGASFDVAIGGINFANAAVNAAYGVSSLFGTFLANELVPAQTHEGAVGGQLLGAVGSAIGITAAVANLLGSALNFILPGVGSLIGSILGTVVGDLFGNAPHPAATDLIDQAGDHYAATHYQTSASDGGSYDVPDRMADPVLAIVNGYLNAVKGAALDHSKQVTIGYQTDPQSSYIIGVPSHPAAGVFFATGYAVQAAAVDLLQHTEAIGGDLLLKRGHQTFIDTPDANRNRGANARRPVRAGGWRPVQGSTASMVCIQKRFA